MTTYTKLKDGNWGIRHEDTNLSSGDSVVVTKKSGETKSETVDRVIWTGDGITLATIRGQSNGAQRSSSRRSPNKYEHYCRNGYDPHQGPCCTGRHQGGDDCGADCCDLD